MSTYQLKNQSRDNLGNLHVGAKVLRAPESRLMFLPPNKF